MDLVQVSSHLDNAVPPVTAAVKPTFDLSLFPKRVLAKDEKVESLAEGLTYEEQLLDWAPLLNQKNGCGFIREALKTGGKDYGQPLWNLTTLVATFLKDGHALAHKMGRSHSEYSKESTDALWYRKTNERKTRNLGWPSCSAIQANGCTACTVCPHLTKNKSPLHLAVSIPSPNPPPQILVGLDNFQLPEGFGINDKGVICVEDITRDKDQPDIITLAPLFMCKLSNPWVQKNPRALNFTTTLDRGNRGTVTIKEEDIVDVNTLIRALGKQGVIPDVMNEKHIRRFIVSLMSKLREADAATAAMPFGWYKENGDRVGFVYGGILFKSDGTKHPSGYGDAKTQDIYKPTGSLQPWLDACKMITDQGRPELEILVASAFAAPLLVSPAENSVLLSLWGRTGAGKSTAVKVAIAVWGSPKKSKEVTLTTSRSVVQKMETLRNLPVYWDEIQDKKAQAHAFTTLFAATEGVGPGRLTSQIEQRERGDWQTILAICSNLSFLDHITTEQRTTTAGMNRVFEIELKKVNTTAPGQINTIDASRITQNLEDNYGMMGLQYAEMLGKDPVAADLTTKNICQAFGAAVNTIPEERFWVAFCGTALAGARFANKLGAQFNLTSMYEYLKMAYGKMRETVKEEATEGGTITNSEEALTAFLKHHIADTIYSDTFNAGAGRPKLVTLIPGAHPPLDKPRPIQVQWAVNDRLLRISQRAFKDFLQTKNMPPRQVLNGLKEHFGAVVVYKTLANGTPFRCGQEHIIHIPIQPNTALEALMNAHTVQT